MRVLIFSADIGEGHDLPARMVRDAIIDTAPDAEVSILDTLQTAGRCARMLVRDNAEAVLEKAPWLFDAQFWLLTGFPPTRWLGRKLAVLLGRRGLLRAIAEFRPDVIVATYPAANEVLSVLRQRGELSVPVVSAITDLAALGYWAHPGCDLHLAIHPESAEEIRSIAGPDTAIEVVRGLTAPGFEQAIGSAQARRDLELPADGPIVVVSGGGWGMGDLQGAVSAALDAAPDVFVLALCGRNDRVREALDATFAGEPRVRVSGFTDRVGEIFAAADVLVHSTAGLTVFEALTRGMRVISYGWGVGHIRLNNAAYTRLGLAEVAADADALRPAIARAVASPRGADLTYASRPAAAGLILELAGGAELLDCGDGTRPTEYRAPA